MLSRTRTSEGGFTLIELLVAAAIGMVVIGVSLVMVMDGVKGSQNAGAGRRAQAEANRVLDELGTDLRSASAPERLDIDSASTRARLREGLASVSASNPAFEDIARATSTELAFRADAVAEPAGVDRNIECVAYRVENAGPAPGHGEALVHTRRMSRSYGPAFSTR